VHANVGSGLQRRNEARAGKGKRIRRMGEEEGK